MKRLYHFLKACFVINIGVIIGIVLHETIWYRNHPEFYELQSAPWYVNILVYGGFAFLIASVIGAVLLILKKRIDPTS